MTYLSAAASLVIGIVSAPKTEDTRFSSDGPDARPTHTHMKPFDASSSAITSQPLNLSGDRYPLGQILLTLTLMAYRWGPIYARE